MAMIEFLSLYAKYLREGLGEWDALQLTRKKLGVNEFFELGLKLGVCPRKTPPLPYKGSGPRDTWEKAFTRAVKGAEAVKARDRVHNQLVQGPVPHVEPFPSSTPVYMPVYMRRVLSRIHDANEWQKVADHFEGRLEGRVLYFKTSKLANDCRADLRKLGVTCGSPQKQFSTGECAFEINIDTIEAYVPETKDPEVTQAPMGVMGEALAQAGLLR